MSLHHLLRLVAVRLSAAGIPFMVTGSVAAAFQGVSRATMDIDIVIDPTEDSLESFVTALLEDGMYVSRDAAMEALHNHGLFNVIDADSGWKIDLIIRKDRQFSKSEFNRRQAADYGDITISVASIEDLILSKLEWAHLGGSSRQVEDVRALLRVAGTSVDITYIEQWVDALHIRQEWMMARASRPSTD